MSNLYDYLCCMIQRKIAPSIQSAAGKFPVISITGPRQSGKTTLAKMLFNDYYYVNLEDLSMREYALNDPKSFLNAFGDYMIIDEVQYAPQLFSFIQVLVDEFREKKYVLTGSQNFLLLEKITQSLAGRTAIFYLLPFSIEELKGTDYEPFEYPDYMIKGSYPVIYDRQHNPAEWLRNYLTTYVERDVRQVLNVGDLTTFQRFISICAGRIGQLVNFSSIANDLSVSYHTVQRWLSILETSFITFRLYPHSVNHGKRLVKSPKLYFNDTGLVCALLGIENKEMLTTHYLKGALFENLVMTELKKFRFNHSITRDLYFWRDNSGREIDCILDHPVSPVAIEIKSGMTIHSDFLTSLNWWKSITGDSGGYLIYGGDKSFGYSGNQMLGWKDCTHIFP